MSNLRCLLRSGINNVEAGTVREVGLLTRAIHEDDNTYAVPKLGMSRMHDLCEISLPSMKTFGDRRHSYVPGSTGDSRNRGDLGEDRYNS